MNLIAVELGKTLGRSIAESNNYRQDFIETEEVTDINLVPIHTINVVGTYFVYSGNLGTSAFVIDHPVYGNINSATLHIDGNFISTNLSSSGIL
jgi:hypothetical protein